ncbi:MAG TPA: DNA polymerase III subunit delta' C-terminal domain-containing protein, partial [Coxiellaceae bacterium]|nr:DNA polymerase III subunit delta' C-terminal domain-containing protein [Coxiellaceae bacterium]
AIKIDQIRALSDQLSRTAHAGGYQVAIISPADAMPLGAANALLKTLEEPSGKVVIFLIDNQQHILPATIASRCQKIRFYDDDTQVMLKTQDNAVREAILNHLQQMILRKTNPIGPISQWIKNDLTMMLDILLLFLIDISRAQKNVSENYFINREQYVALKNLSEKISAQKIQQLIEMINEKKNYLSRGINLNVQLCLENIFIALHTH